MEGKRGGGGGGGRGLTVTLCKRDGQTYRWTETDSQTETGINRAFMKRNSTV